MFDKIGITKYKLIPPIELQQRTALMYEKNFLEYQKGKLSLEITNLG
jgi:hypothetical protein